MLIVDSREDQKIIKELKFKGIEFQVDALNYGDYILLGEDAKIVIERKSITDFMSSVVDGRIWQQLKGLEQYKDYQILIVIEGFYDYGIIRKNVALSNTVQPYLSYWRQYMSFTPARFIGTLTSIIKSWHNVSIVVVGDKPHGWKPEQTEQDYGKSRQFIDFIISLNEKIGKPEEGGIWVGNTVQKKNRTLEEETIDVISTFGGIGKVKSTELLKKFGSVKKIVSAKKEKLAEIVGDKTAEHLLEVFNFGKK